MNKQFLNLIVLNYTNNKFIHVFDIPSKDQLIYIVYILKYIKIKIENFFDTFMFILRTYPHCLNTFILLIYIYVLLMGKFHLAPNFQVTDGFKNLL